MDICAANWNEDDNANITAAPDGAPEGMAPSGVNNVLRAMMGAVKRWYGWSAPRTSTGTGTAYTLNYAIAPGALVDGMMHLVQFHMANGVGVTLSVNNLTATPLHYYAAGAWRVTPPGLIGADQVFRVVYHSSSGAYRILRPRDDTGIVESYAGSTAPAGTLLCYGQALSRTDYAGLFAAIGTTYGAPSGSTFNLPDERGRVEVGRSDMGGADAGNLSGGGTLGAGLGAQSQAAITTVTGSTSGSLSVSTTSFAMDGPDLIQGTSGSDNQSATGSHTHNNVRSSGSTSGSLSVTASGASGAFSVVQPSRVVNKIIRV